MVMANHQISKESLRASGQVQSLSRALRLMNTLADNPQGLSLSEVAHGVDLPTSTAHRLLTTLQNERYVRFDAERSNWLIGVQAFRVGAAFMRSRDIIATARPYMRRLMEVSGETVNLGIIDRGEVVYLAQVETQKMMRAMTGPGGRSEILTSSVGRAILAFMRQDECEKLINSLHFQPGVAQLPKASGVLQSDLQATRVRGYSIDNEENSVGLRCVASVIFDEHGEPLAGVSVSGPTARVSEERIASLGETVAAIVAEITAELGGTLPDRKTA